MDFMELVASDDVELYDFEEKEALLWKQPTQENQKEEVKTTVSPPGDVWIVPPRFKDVEKHIDRIELATNTFMDFNKNENQIEIWGAPEDIEEAIVQWNNLSSNKLTFANERRKNEKNERIAAKKQEPGWAKPDKAPVNKKQEAKFKRREERKRKENMYKKKPEESKKFPFNVFVMIPDQIDVCKDLLFGEKDENLNPVRIETECHIWYDEPQGTKGIINIVGETKESVDDATLRVGHLLVKASKARSLDKGWILHALEPPNKKCQIRITDPPPGFYLPHETSEKNLKYKLIEPVYEGDRISVVGGTNEFKELNQNFDIDKLKRKHELSIIELRKSFLGALEAVHLCDEEIKMRVRFGRVYLVNWGDFEKILIPITDLTSRVLTKSKFATCLATERDQLNRLLEVLSQGNQKWGSSPSSEFKICAIRRIPEEKEQSLPQCAFEIHFEKNRVKNNYGKNDEKYEGRIGLWNAIIRQRNVLDINMMNMDNYSWKLNIKTARRLPNDEKCPQGRFVNGLRICQQGRLVYLNTVEIRVTSVCEKTKWKFWWEEDYIVEVTRYEFWDVSKHMKETGIEIPINREDRPKVSYGVTLYKRSWDERFAFNSNLRAGEAPDWHPHELMEEEKDLLGDIRSFSKILQQYHSMQQI